MEANCASGSVGCGDSSFCVIETTGTTCPAGSTYGADVGVGCDERSK